MTARALMFMGTGSDVGKSLIVAGLCRAFLKRGLRVAPFKPQNMSNNAAVTIDGGEIGRAQATQALAAGRAPVTAMNPVLLKPEHETGAQLIVRGQRVGSFVARDYFKMRGTLMPQVLSAFEELCAENDLILVEGAGSASEVNLRQGDIANFGFARAANVPVVVIGDIQRGGVIASLVGTFAVIDREDAGLIAGTLVNRFQGDVSLFADGIERIVAATKRPVFGPVPYFADAGKLPAEDILGLQVTPRRGGGRFRIVVPRLPRIANFDDLDPLRAEPMVDLEIVAPGRALPRDADLIILPGSKATRADLAFLRSEGWDIDLVAHVRAGGKVLGLCAGYQMLGRVITDPDGVEGVPGTSEGLGLLEVETRLAAAKTLRVQDARWAPTGAALSGYHMHMGETEGVDCARPFALEQGLPEGATSASGAVMGTYLHGLFAADDFRRGFLEMLGAEGTTGLNYMAEIEGALDDLALLLEESVDLDGLLGLARMPDFGGGR